MNAKPELPEDLSLERMNKEGKGAIEGQAVSSQGEIRIHLSQHFVTPRDLPESQGKHSDRVVI